MESFWRDVRYALRMLGKSRGFTAVAVLTLALGIGANTAIFSVTYGILLKPLPYPNASRLMAINSWTAETGGMDLSPGEVGDIQRQSRSFEQVADYTPARLILTGDSTAEQVDGAQVSAQYFSVFGVAPLWGRAIWPTDLLSGHGHVAVLSYDLWQQRFGGDPRIVGKEVTLSVLATGMILDHALKGEPYTVVGVMPGHSRFPNDGDVWVPLSSSEIAGWSKKSGMDASMSAERSFCDMVTIALLKHGVTLDHANAELHMIAGRLASQYPETDKGRELSAQPLAEKLTHGALTGLVILLGAVSFILLLACVSVSNLLVAQGWTRHKEVAIRETLGATRVRLIRQFLSESILLSVVAGTLGLLFAFWGVDLLRAIAPPETPRLDAVVVNWLVLVYALGVSFTAGILSGLAPVLQLARRELGASLKEEKSVSFLSASSGHPHRLRGLLAIVEIALAYLLVVGATLAIRSFVNLTRMNLGYQPDRILTMSVRLSSSTCAKIEACAMAVQDMLDLTRSLPGVESVAAAAWRPLSTVLATSVQLSSSPESRASTLPSAEWGIVSPGYFRTMGISLLAGRDFSSRDLEHSTHVAIVNEAMARRDFSGRPLGKKFRVGSGISSFEIVGEVDDTRDVNLSRAPLPAFYVPFSQAAFIPGTYLFVRTAANPLAISPLVRQRVWSVDKNAPVSDVETMDEAVAQKVADPRFRTLLLGVFGALGLILAMVGIYGVISYGVTQRTHEIGVRMALGAQPANVLRMVIREGMSLAGAGIVAGIGGALALTRFLRSLLFEVRPTDPATFLGVAILLTLVALLACYIPARRAMKVDPMVALRYE